MKLLAVEQRSQISRDTEFLTGQVDFTGDGKNKASQSYQTCLVYWNFYRQFATVVLLKILQTHFFILSCYLGSNGLVFRKP
jgi:hypothetical protein